MNKLPLCCVRRKALIHNAEVDLARVARKITGLQQRNQNAERMLAKIPGLKAAVAEAKESMIDHEAEHAGGFAVTA